MKTWFLVCITVIILATLVSCSKKIDSEEIQSMVGESDATIIQEGTTPNQQDSGSITDTLENVLKLGGKYKCTVSSEDVESVIYIDGENSRSETFIPSGKSYVVSKHMPDGKICSFSWFSEEQQQNQMFKICTKPEVDQASTPSANAQTSNHNVKVYCNKYFGTIDLEPPTNLEIIDLTSLQTGPSGRIVGVVSLDN